MRRYDFPLPYTDTATMFDAYFKRPYALFLDSSDRNHPHGRYSYIMSNPVEVLSLSHTDDPFAQLTDLAARYRFDSPHSPYPFTGGLAGLLGYDLGRALEHLPIPAHKHDSNPDMMVGVYTDVIAFDHHKKTACRFVWSNTPLTSPPNAPLSEKDINAPHSSPLHFKETDHDQTIASIEKTIDYIHAGDIFQANISQNTTASLPDGFCAWAHYKHLRNAHPAPFGAFMNCGDMHIASISPERFLTASPQGHVTTRPIKGTLPAHKDPNILINSEKDRAENIMIVDLLRNDLSKVCIADSVTVSELCTLETFISVHHLVSTVEGQLRTGQTAVDLIKACFPGGSITGAPKIRAMEIIDALEPYKRGFYCGSLLTLGFDGALDSNILIRTLVYNDNTVSIKAGGGITAQSGPVAECQEMDDKVRGIIESFAA